MRNVIVAALLATLLSPLSHAVSCGTVAAPTACSVNVGGVVKYTFSNFALVNSTSSGGASTYVAGDIAIDVATAFGQGLDIDGNGSYSATTDGLLVLRYLLGLRGSALINGAIGASPTRSSASTIEAYLGALTP